MTTSASKSQVTQPAEATACRERQKFPWRGRLLADVKLEGASFRAGEQVTVHEKHDGLFAVYAQRDGHSYSGPVPQASVDEALSAVIEQRLLGNRNIIWSAGSGNWHLPGLVNYDLELPRPPGTLPKDLEVAVDPTADPAAETCEVRDGSGTLRRVPGAKLAQVLQPNGTGKRKRLGSTDYYVYKLTEEHQIPVDPVAVAAGTRIAATVSPGHPDQYRVESGGGTADVPSDAVTLWRRRNSLITESPIQMLCFEFVAYAAALGGLTDDFAGAALNVPGKSKYVCDYWVEEALGAAVKPDQIPLAKLEPPGLQFHRGDLVIFYSKGDVPTHLAVATGDGQMLYSLWDPPQPYPVRVSARDLRNSGMPTVYLKTATPRWHA